ncbi:MAG: AI-2E family transporter, partial [Gammaproteobacteria bacterium]|nr:AI-2E family transporter [Gammaproteobacteria bacterium]
MPRLNAAPFWQTALVVVSVTVTAATLVTVLYVAQVLFIPIVLAIFLTFLLAPVVSLLQRLKLGRKPSVVLVILLVAFMLGGAGWMLSVQVKNLIDELPWYTENINDKLRGFRAMGEGNTFGQLQEMATDIAEAWNLRRDSPHEPDGRPAPEPESVGELVAVVLEPS